MERSGIPTAVLCNLVPIARRVGVPRVVPTRGIPYPAGDPALEPEAERSWRRQLLETALRALTTAVTQPTVFEPEPSGTGAVIGGRARRSPRRSSTTGARASRVALQCRVTS